MKLFEDCKVVCRKTYTDAELNMFAEKIEEDYRINWVIDNLPSATKFYTESVGANNERQYVTHYEKGFALGFVAGPESTALPPGTKYINNHVRLLVFYHEDPARFSGARVVGFEVEPFSVKHQVDGVWKQESPKLLTCSATTKVTRALPPQNVNNIKDAKDRTIIFTYDVRWEKSDIKWASRWDVYLKMTDSQIHWFSIINSIMIVLFLSGMVAMIMVRTLHRDLRRYNEIEMTEEAQQEESGWKLIHSEVFRPPAFGAMFSILVGTGVQVFGMALVTLIFAVLGFLSPANRGALMTALLLLFVFMGIAGGYASTRTYKMFKLTTWKRNTLLTSLLFPGIAFTVFFILNVILKSYNSTAAVPYTTLLSLLLLWFGISVPLIYIGSWLAMKKESEEPPCKVNPLPRLILPNQPWYNNFVFSTMIGGVLPFGAVFIEIFFIMSSVWLHQFYYVFGVLAIVFVILIITCAEITIVMCYFQLCNEDYHWWWRSYLTCGSSALYVFLYSVMYFFTKLEIVSLVSALLFFSYMFLASLAFFVLTGTIGFYACYFFMVKIYSSLKID
jgi:transmembrane 9 superfamily protein 2/4